MFFGVCPVCFFYHAAISVQTRRLSSRLAVLARGRLTSLPSLAIRHGDESGIDGANGPAARWQWSRRLVQLGSRPENAAPRGDPSRCVLSVSEAEWQKDGHCIWTTNDAAICHRQSSGNFRRPACSFGAAASPTATASTATRPASRYDVEPYVRAHANLRSTCRTTTSVADCTVVVSIGFIVSYGCKV